MVSLANVQNGIVKYIDRELLPKLTGWQKWAFGALSSIWVGNIANTFNKLKQSAFVGSLGVIDDRDMIDIDQLYREFRKQAEKGAVTFAVPGVGPLTLDQQDVDKIYQYIMEV
jgi:hypothetical protein